LKMKIFFSYSEVLKMHKKKISKKQDFSLKDMKGIKLKSMEGITVHSSTDRLKDKSFIAAALWECLVEDDVELFKELLRTHLELTNKDDLAKRAGIPRRTLFRMLSPEGNPTLSNVSKIIHELCA
jgi:DNA-binding phage protein